VGYSIFSETMADMNYKQIEKAAEEKLPVLFPIAVIEEHGPHLCLGTDTYLTYQLCKDIKSGLMDLGIDSIIVPPYYWGINSVTGGFHGSFTIQPETMVMVLCDLLVCLDKWGFRNIFLFNFHGDFKHNITISNAVKKAHLELGADAYFIVPDFFIQRAGLTGSEEYLLVHPTSHEPKPPTQYADIHAGDFETSLMAKYFPDLVDMDLALKLEPSRTTYEQLRIWQQGGEKAKAITPLGYCGDPSKADTKKAQIYKEEMVRGIPQILYKHITGRDI